MIRFAIAAILLLLSGVSSAADPTPIVLVSGETKTRFAKLGEALAAAKPGDRVIVASGEHRGAFVLPAGVSLEGKGTLVAAGTRPALVSGGKGAAVCGLAFRGSRTALLIDVTGGSVGVSGCHFTGGGGGIRVGERAAASIEKCLFLDLAGTGIHLIGTETTVRYCRIRGSAMFGMRIDGSKALVTRTVVEGCGRGGLYIAGEDESTIEHCHIVRNVLGGIAVFGRGHTRIVENSFVGNLRAGVEIDIASSATVRGNMFVDNTVGISRFETAQGTHYAPDIYPIGRPDVADNAFCGNGRDHSNFATDPVGYRADRGFRAPPAGDFRPAAGSRLLREGFPYPEAGLSDAFRTPPAPPPEPRKGAFGAIVGRILDETGEPISDACVVLGLRGSQRVARTRPDGGFRLTEVPEGTWRPSASARGYLIRMWPEPVHVRPDETAELPDLRLEKDRPILGRIDNGRGEPAPGAIAWALDPERPGYQGTRRGIAGWNGKFRVDYLPAGRRALFTFRRMDDEDGLVVVHARTGIAAGSEGHRLSRGVERVVIHITDGVVGAAKDLDLMVRGTPVGGGEVLLGRWKNICELSALEWPLKLAGREVTLPVLLPPGTYDFVVRRREHRRVVRVAHATGVVVRPEEARRVELVTARPGRIEGQVIDGEGKPIAGALVESAETGPPPALLRVDDRDPPRLYRARTDDSGAFRIEAVQPGDRRLRMTRSGYREQVVAVPGVKPRQVARIRVEMTR